MTHPRRPDPDKGLFETMLVLDGRPVELDAHLARLEASIEELFPNRAKLDLREEIRGVAAGVAAGSIRATVTPAAASLALSERKAPDDAVALHSIAVPGGLGAHKWADRSLLDEAGAELPAGALLLIVSGETALETSRANVFVVRDGALFTPPLDGRILPGVTRMRVIELAEDAGIQTQEEPLSRDDLLAADEVFLTGSVRGIERVSALDGMPLAPGKGMVGRLAAALWRAWTDTKTAARFG